MKRRVLTGLLPVLLLGASATLAAEIAPGVDLLPGRFVSGTQPDGNTVVFRAPAGLIVVDTGRHAEHTQAILDLAAKAGVPVVAVINTHWHLDHIGGNPRVRHAYPGVRVWASGALTQAMTGFLATYRAQLQEAAGKTQDPSERRGFQDELAIIDAGSALAPDEVVTVTGPRTIGGRALQLGLERNAVTAGDVWVFDPATGVLASGDLVTLPAPLFDTACPRGWQAALARLASVPFTVLVPGHGRPMSRVDFERYRAGFDRLLACAASKRTDEACGDGWMRDIGPLMPESDRGLARRLLQYYLPNNLRAAPEKTARLCGDERPGSTATPGATPRHR
ncbi:MAG: MBL fold metallo-hydrolase [Acidobacteriia bacterium]|nr:MBL fold metallo-hydrolase [Terriglobia bacterium]